MNVFKNCLPIKNTKLQKLYDYGSKMLEKEMDIIKVIKHIRNVNTFMKLNIDET